MMCSLKSSFCTNINKMTSGKRICEISIKDEGPNEPIVNAEVELRKSKRSRISKSFGPDFVAYELKNEPHTFKEVMCTPEV